MIFKRVATLVASASMALATATAIAPAAAAQTARVDAQRTVTFSCTGDRNGNTVVSPNTFQVSYPEEVAPGEVFTVSVQPEQMRNNTNDLYRMTFDYGLPSNTQIISLNLSGGQGLSGTAPSVVRVAANNKTTNAAGTVARIWGGVSAQHGSNADSDGTGGMQVRQNTDFRLPQLDIVMRAPSTVGDVMTVGLPGANLTGNNAAATDFQWVRDDPGWFSGNDANNCTSGSAAAALTTTTVSDAEYAVIESTTRIVGGDQLVDTSEPLTIRAQVSSPYAPAGNLSQGTVTFRDADTGEEFGTATPDADGFAEIEYEFDRIPDDEPDVPLNLVAEYSGFEGDAIDETIAPSSDSVVLTLTPKPVVQWVTDFTARATIGELTEDALPVTINTTFQRPGLEYPEGTLVQLYRNGEAFGEPVLMPETGTTLTWQDELPRAERNAVYRYTVELETVRVEYDQWTGSTAQPAAVIVRGTDDSLPEPAEPGSLEMGSAELGNLSSDLVGYDVAPLSVVLPELSASGS